ncbi:hypothetical protein [Pandoraea sp. NPDC090278]|uniref:hypothetical protein n=1 Tax=Pandoraea sp. NPDC090278 TaxID=3364391 RepID=UPI00383AAA55
MNTTLEDQPEPAEFEVIAGNPFLDGLPTPPRTCAAAINLLNDTARSRRYVNSAAPVHEDVLRNAGSVYCATAVDGTILTRLLSAIADSYEERDIRRKSALVMALRVNQLLYTPRAERIRMELQRRAGTVRGLSPSNAENEIRIPNTQPRALLVKAPLRMGRRTLASLLEEVIGAGYRPITLDGNGGAIRSIQLRVVRISWPNDGTVKGLVHEFAAAIDRIAGRNNEFVELVRLGFKTAGELEIAMQSVALAANVGTLFVEGINVSTTKSSECEQIWNVLATFTRKTGIVLVCFATPAAAALGLQKYISVIGDLTTLGTHELIPSRTCSNHWHQVCKANFNAFVRPVTGNDMPEWLPKLLLEVTRGRNSLVKASLQHVAMTLLESGLDKLEEKHFRKYLENAVEPYRESFEALTMVADKTVRLTYTSLQTFGDMFTSVQAEHLRVKPLLDE